MVNENVDIASLLSVSAGELLAKAYQIHTEMKKYARNSDSYFELRSKERVVCIQGVILFQASMEAMINEEIENEPKLKVIKKKSDELNSKFKILSFKNKWELAFEVLGVPKNCTTYLEKYLKFYIKFRVPITHAKSRYVEAEKFNFTNVYEGIKNGYYAVESFYTHLIKFSKEHTWKEFCKKVQIPEIS